MAGYTRQSTFADGDTITAALFNNEYNQLFNAFSNTNGHKHDGTEAEGPVIGLIGDAGETSPNNKVLIDTTNNHIEFYVEVSSSSVQQLYIADGAIVPVTDSDIDIGTTSLRFKDAYIDTVTTTGNVEVGGNLTVTGTTTFNGGTITMGDAATDNVVFGADVDSHIIPDDDDTYDLGSSTQEWRNLYIDGTAHIDTLDVDANATVAGTLGVTGTSTLTGNVTATNDLSVGGNLTVTGNATISGNLTFGDADTDSINLAAEIDSDIIPNTDGTYDLGSATKEWQDLYIDGTANIDSLVADTADINGGTIDGATIATSDITVGAGKTLDVSSGTLTLADDQISGDKVEGGTIAATTVTTLTSTTGNITTVNSTTTNATTVDTTNIEVTNLKAKDGTSAGSIADSTGIVTLASSVLTTTDINGGTIDGVTIGGTSAGAVTFTDLSDGTITITAFADEDDMSSDSATLVPTQQSVKAYVDSQVTAQDLDFQGDTGGALSIDLDSESLTIAGGTGLDTVGSGNTVTVNIDSTVATLTGTQTLTNKTLTSPDVNTPDIDGGTIDSTVIGGATPAAGTFTTLTANTSITGTLATAAQPNITSVGTLSSLTTSGNVIVGGNLTVNGTTTTLNTATLDVEDKNITLNYGSGDTTGSANGAGITIQDAVDASTDASILWDTTNDEFDFSHPINVTGKITGTGTSVFTNLDISGDVDVDGTLETDALTIGGVTSVPFEAADHSKLDGIESGATGDQTNAEIRAAVEAATDSNVFTDADHSKLNAIEANADVTDTANVTSAGALMDSELTSIADVKALDQSVVSGASPTFTTTNFTDATNKRFMTDAQETKLDSVESGATADQTAAEIRTLVESATDSNVFTDADHSKLNGIEANANNYVLPTNLAGDDINIDTGALTGATVISDLDFNITTNTSGLVTDANASVATRNLTLANLGYTGATDATNNTGTVTSVAISTNAGLDGGGTITSSGSVTISLDLSELTDMTDGVSGANDELILLDSGAERRKRIGEINLGQFNNDQGWTSNTGDITAVTVSGNVTGGGTSGSVAIGFSSTPSFSSLTVDDITINGSTISDGGNLTIDAEGKILLSADNAGQIELYDGSLNYGLLAEDNSNFILRSIIQDEDILFQGYDGASLITALTLDMSNAGTASFNAGVLATALDITSTTPKVTFVESDLSKQYEIGSFGGSWAIRDSNAGQYRYILETNGNHIFNEGSQDCDFRVESNNSTHMLVVDGGNDRVGINSSTPSKTLDVSGDVIFGTGNRFTTATNSFKSSATGENGASIRSAVSTAANPTYSNVDDTNTGMFFPAADHLAFSAGGNEVCRLDSAEYFFVGQSDKTSSVTNGGVYIAGDVNVGATNRYAQMFIQHNSSVNHGIAFKELRTAGGTQIEFLNSTGSVVGSITHDASATSYITSSDYRLKENVDYTFDATTRLKQLKPARFNFISDADTTVDGFLAHEVQDIVPEAIRGEKDAVDDEGNPEYQGIDQSKLVPLLVKTIQELEARITALES